MNPRAGISPTKKYFNPAELTTGSRRRLSRIWLRPDILEQAGTVLDSFELVVTFCCNSTPCIQKTLYLQDGASEGIRNLIGFRSHPANLRGMSAFCQICLMAISHQSERKRIGTGSNCAKSRTYTHPCRVIGGEGRYMDIALICTSRRSRLRARQFVRCKFT